jgi:hypothetical protein
MGFGLPKRSVLSIFLAFILAFEPGCAASRFHRESLLDQIGRETHPSPLLAGAAKRDITPPVGTPLAGYARRRGKPSQGIHDRLYARALAIKNDTDLLLFVSCDLVVVNEPLYREVLRRINEKQRVPQASLFLFASHTHSGAGAFGERFFERLIAGRYDARVFETISREMADAALEAMDALRPARIRLVEGRLEGMIENRMIESGSVDDEITVLRVDQEGKPLALLVNFAAHPTVLSAKNMLFSADFPGFMQSELEDDFPGAVCLFANGASGDQRIHGFTGRGSFERAQAIGRALAEKTRELAQPSAAEEKAEIVALVLETDLPPVKIRRGFLVLPSWLGGFFLEKDVFFHAARVNDIVFLSVPGELAGELGLEIKNEARRSGFRPVLIGYANGYIGYIIPEKHYDLKTYEAGVSFYGRHLDRHVKESVLAPVRALGEAKQ